MVSSCASAYNAAKSQCMQSFGFEKGGRGSKRCSGVSQNCAQTLKSAPDCFFKQAPQKWSYSLVPSCRLIGRLLYLGSSSYQQSCLQEGLALQQGLREKRGPQKRRRKVTASAWQDEAPYLVAIGIAIATSAAPLLFPVPWSLKAAVDKKERFDDFNTFGSEDTKYTAMAAISFLPLFNWLAWVFAWLDSSDPRYALYAAAYLAPWVKNGLDFTDGWLPLGAVALGVAHVQLERYVQSEGPTRSLPNEEEPPKAEKKLPGATFDARGWADYVQEGTPVRKPLTEDEIRKREEKWELRRWDEKFAEKMEAEAVAEPSQQE